MRDDEFEWDDRKAAANLAKHRISFEDARLAFDDDNAHERADLREDYGEDRSSLFGSCQRPLDTGLVHHARRARPDYLCTRSTAV